MAARQNVYKSINGRPVFNSTKLSRLFAMVSRTYGLINDSSTLLIVALKEISLESDSTEVGG
jgi:hypothetical protein